jgi:hypothetical protein
MKREFLKYTDNFRIDDDIINKLKAKKPGRKGDMDYGIKGVVLRSYIDGKLIDTEVPNLVVAFGRRFNAQRIIGKKHPDDPLDLTLFTLQHCGFGSGGSTFSGDTPVLVQEDICELDLHNPISLDSSYLASPSGELGVAKLIEEINIIENTHIECLAPINYTWIECVITKERGEPLELEPGASVKIDEAMLYISNPSKSIVYPFAHACFTPKYIEKESEFVMVWDILS